MNIELPKDAEGREIPLDTSELFIADGTKDGAAMMRDTDLPKDLIDNRR